MRDKQEDAERSMRGAVGGRTDQLAIQDNAWSHGGHGGNGGGAGGKRGLQRGEFAAGPESEMGPGGGGATGTTGEEGVVRVWAGGVPFDGKPIKPRTATVDGCTPAEVEFHQRTGGGGAADGGVAVSV
jgi:hypothetical protein